MRVTRQNACYFTHCAVLNWVLLNKLHVT